MCLVALKRTPLSLYTVEGGKEEEERGLEVKLVSPLRREDS